MDAPRQQFDKRTVLLRGEEQRALLHKIIERLPLDDDRPLRIVIDDPLPAHSRDQEQKYHAMIGDIARQYAHAGRHWAADDMKRILVDQFRRETANDPDFGQLWSGMGAVEMAPAFDGSGVVMLGVQTRKFPRKLAALFIEWLYGLGVELNIQWTEPRKKS